MDTFLPLICLAIGIAMPLGGVFLLVRRAMRQLAVAHAYQEVAARLGLSADTRGVSVQGHLGDRRLWIGEVMVGHGKDRRMLTWGVIDLDRPLGLGLLLRRRGLSERLFRRGRSPEVTVDDPALTRLIEVRGDEPTRIRQVLDPEVRRALVDLARRWPDVVVTDGTVRVHLRHPEASGDGLHALVDGMHHVATTLEEARRAVQPPAHLERLIEDWAPMALRLGLDLEPWLPAAVGIVDGRRLVLAPRRDEQGYAVELRLAFRTHPETGFRVRHQVEPDGYWSVGQDIQVDDARFDAAFVVKGWDPERIRRLLKPDVRQPLLALAEAGLVEADDRGLRVRHLPLAASELEPLVRTALTIPAGLGW